MLGQSYKGWIYIFFVYLRLIYFYPVSVSENSIDVNNTLSNKYPFYAYNHSKHYEDPFRHSIVLRAFENEKTKNNGVIHCMSSGSCKFKKITSVSDVSIFNNVRIDYVGIGIGGLGDGLERAGFYTVSVLENPNFDKSKSDKSVEDNDMSDKNLCEKNLR